MARHSAWTRPGDPPLICGECKAELARACRCDLCGVILCDGCVRITGWSGGARCSTHGAEIAAGINARFGKTSEQVGMPCRPLEGGEPSTSRAAEAPRSSASPADVVPAIRPEPGEICSGGSAAAEAATRGIETRRVPAGDTAGFFSGGR